MTEHASTGKVWLTSEHRHIQWRKTFSSTAPASSSPPFTSKTAPLSTINQREPIMNPPPPPTIDLLLNLIDTRPNSILTSLSQHPHLASASDSHGYSLVHAAVSYNQPQVLRELIQTYKVNVNLLDEDGESPLFAAENVAIAKSLVEDFGADWRLKNSEGKTAEERIAEEEGEDHEVAIYLRGLRTGGSGSANGNVANGADVPDLSGLPGGVKINIDTMAEDEVGDAPDPEIRRRIEELAARDDFQTEEGQRRLRELVTEVVSGMGAEEAARSVRRRVE
ncbi:uncharacterized protein EI97DRAFT_433510 [Westerdykella ornata]|uniref:Uncharacterized protein n=1 Tax=Westerdykella ornata TaxID=318751 RepID=A0A6A6JIP4_WESOR|nr:uncharacterized protein EI97DRAFT_433510 [Westerdykella ornata]KAF2276094.1 hypothetical protein EI97DRAFT_433510 [Westerdykella ornata]